MAHPWAMAAAHKVLKAAEAWRDALIPNTSTATQPAARNLAEAVDEYRRVTKVEHVQGPDLDADDAPAG